MSRPEPPRSRPGPPRAAPAGAGPDRGPPAGRWCRGGRRRRPAALPPQQACRPPVRGAAGLAAAGGRTSGPRRLWGEATSTGGGRAALVAAAVLGPLLLLTGIGLSPPGPRRDGRGRGRCVGIWSDELRPRQRHGPMGQRARTSKQGNGVPGGNGIPGRNPGQGNSPDDPANRVTGSVAAPGGPRAEVRSCTASSRPGVTGTPTVMVVQTGAVTAYTAGKSIAVKSADGFGPPTPSTAPSARRPTSRLAAGVAGARRRSQGRHERHEPWWSAAARDTCWWCPRRPGRRLSVGRAGPHRRRGCR